jgi:hypothetical protein
MSGLPRGLREPQGIFLKDVLHLRPNLKGAVAPRRRSAIGEKNGIVQHPRVLANVNKHFWQSCMIGKRGRDHRIGRIGFSGTKLSGRGFADFALRLRSTCWLTMKTLFAHQERCDLRRITD